MSQDPFIRSPLSRMPNLSDIPGLPLTLPQFFRSDVQRGIISEIMLDETGRPTFLFRVTPMASDGTPERKYFLACMLQAGVGNMADKAFPPGGIYYLPQVGSRVMMVRVKTMFVIVGFFTGPLNSTLDVAVDDDGRRVSYNPGIGTAQSRLVTPPGWDVPWLFDIEPGDTLIARDHSMVKVGGRGVLLSSNPVASLIMLKMDGELLHRFTSKEELGLGWWSRFHYKRGTEKKAEDEEGYKEQKPKDGSFYRCDIAETTIYPLVKKAYLISQQGHISRSYVDMGRSSIYAEETAEVIKQETEKRNYAMIRQAIIQPIREQPSPSEEEKHERQTALQALEVSKEGVAYEIYDFQADVDGSFRLRSGNLNKCKGGQSVPPTKEMDISIEYNSKLAKFFLRIGQLGSEQTLLRMTGLTEKTASVYLKTTRAEVECRKTLRAYAKQAIRLKSKSITLDCSSLTVTGSTSFKKDVSINDTLSVGSVVIAKAYALGGSGSGGGGGGGGNTTGTQPPNKGFVAGMAGLGPLENLTFAAGLAALAGFKDAAFLSALASMQIMKGATLMKGLQGVVTLQAMKSLQGKMGQNALAFSGQLDATLKELRGGGLLGQGGEDAISFMAQFSTLGGIQGGLSGFVNNSDLTCLKGAAGTTFMTDFKDLLTSPEAENGLPYIRDVVGRLGASGLLAVPGAFADEFVAALGDVQAAFLDGGSLSDSDGVPFLSGLVTELDTNGQLTKPELVGVKGQEAMYTLYNTLAALGSDGIKPPAPPPPAV